MAEATGPRNRSKGTGKASAGSPGGAGDGQAPPSAPAAPICSVVFCPICTMVTAMGEARPDLVEHLLLAGREMLLAARAVIDARLETMDGDKKPNKLERIRIE
jgi:hypothetical protein